MACRRRNGGYNRLPVKVLALDYGSARTGVAVSDPTGSIARPLAVVESAASEVGIERVLKLAHEQSVERIVVGMPLTLRGQRGAQAAETEEFVSVLRQAADIPVDSFDERFTTRLADQTASGAPSDAVAAAHLLSGYLEWRNRRS